MLLLDPCWVTMAFDAVPVTEKVARTGGLYRRGYGPIHGTGLADALIAATTSESGAKLVSFNRRHFPWSRSPYLTSGNLVVL